MSQILTEPFFIRALLAVIIISIVSAPYGCMIVWQRMGFFGDAIAHSALGGLALAFLLDMQPQMAVILVAMLVAVIFFYVREVDLSPDVILAIISHSTIALAAIGFSLTKVNSSIVTSFLFGDVLYINNFDLVFALLVSLVNIVLMYFLWRPLIVFSIDPELGRQTGIRLRWMQLVFMIALSILTAAMVKIMGVLLVVAMLVLPAASARRLLLRYSPEGMMLSAGAIAVAASIVGMLLSAKYDSPSGATIVVVLAIIFALSRLRKARV